MMMKTSTAVVLAAAMLSLGPLAPARADCSSPNDSSCSRGELMYLQNLQLRGFDVSGSNAGQLIHVGKSTCSDIRSAGPSVAAQRLWQSNNGNISMSDAGAIVTAAAGLLCR